jgi:hypothetical protein
MSKWLRSHRGRSFLVGAVAAVTIGGLAYVVVGPLDAFASAGASPALLVSPGSAAPAPAGATLQVAPTSASESAAATFIAKGASANRLRVRALAVRLLRHSVHVSFVVKDGKTGAYETVTLDRGKLQSVSSTSISILSADGVTVTEPVNSSTNFVRTTEATLTSGERVVLVGINGDARYVVAPKASSALGKGLGTTSTAATPVA